MISEKLLDVFSTESVDANLLRFKILDAEAADDLEILHAVLFYLTKEYKSGVSSDIIHFN